jgi:hypothetical protein
MAQKHPPQFCWGCGTELNDSQKFCTRCGKPVNHKKATAPASKTPTKKVPPKTASFQNYGAPNNSVRNKVQQPQTRRIKSANSQERLNTPRQQQYIPESPSLPIYQDPIKIMSDPEVFQRLDKLETKIDDLDIKKKFDTMEYKLNALFGEVHFDDQIKELTKKVEENSPKEVIAQFSGNIERRQTQLETKIEKLATSDDILQLRGKIDTLNLDSFESRLRDIDTRLANFDVDEKMNNLARNTVDKFNNLERKLDNFVTEDRKRLTNIDNKIGMFEGRLESMNNALATLVPSIIKLTEKVNQLQGTINSSQAKRTVEKSSPPKKKIDLPPFPGSKSKKTKSLEKKDKVDEIKEILKS